MNDWQLVAAYAQGDEQAFESLVRKFFPIVYSAAVRQVSDSHLAEEITQSVFILFARKAPRLSQNVSLTGWFLRTTRFVARDALKQLSRRQRREQQAADAASMTLESDPAWKSLAPLLDEALLALSAGEQECVVARFIEGRSFREIGNQQRISEDTAQKRVSRGLDKMRLFFERRGLKVAATSIAGLLAVDLAHAAESQLVATTLSGVQAAMQGHVAGVKGLALADQAARSMAWRLAVKLGVTIAAGVVLVGGGVLAWRQVRPALPSAFQVGDNRIDLLGRDWAAVVRRAAFLASFPQGGPPAGDPSRAAFDQATAFVLAETTRVSTDLDAVLQAGNERVRLAEFLTVELRETLALDERQQTEVFVQLRGQLSQGATFKDGLRSVLNSKAAFASVLRGSLSTEQRQRFDQTYGANAIGLFAFAALVLSG